MPALIQICIVTVTIGLLALALWALLTLTRFLNGAAKDLARISFAIQQSSSRLERVADEAGALATSLRECVPPIRRVVDRFEVVGQRTADISNTLLEGIELPAFTATAVARGVRAGANHLLGRLMHRFTTRHTTNHGGLEHE